MQLNLQDISSEPSQTSSFYGTKKKKTYHQSKHSVQKEKQQVHVCECIELQNYCDLEISRNGSIWELLP